MGTNCAPPFFFFFFFFADLFLFCYERDFVDSLSHDAQVRIIEAFHSASRYLDDPLNIE